MFVLVLLIKSSEASDIIGMSKYDSEYKCKRCGCIHQFGKTSIIINFSDARMVVNSAPFKDGGMTLRKEIKDGLLSVHYYNTVAHECVDGGMGVSEFIGFKKV